MAPKLPKKLASAKKSLSRDTSSGNATNDGDISSSQPPPSSASPMSKLQSKKFKKPSMPNISTDGIKKRTSLLERNVSSGSGTDYNNTPTTSRRDSAQQQQSSLAGTGGRLTNKGTYSKQQPFEVSEGAMRLNRILDSNTTTVAAPSSSKQGTMISTSRIKSIDGNIVRKQVTTPNSSSLLNPTSSTSLIQSTSINNTTTLKSDYIPPSTISLPDPTDENAVGEMTCRISSKMRIDLRSIGGRIVNTDGKVEGRTGNILLKDNWEELVVGTDINNGGKGSGGEDTEEMKLIPTRPMNRLTNECLFSMCVSQFDLSVGEFHICVYVLVCVYRYFGWFA